jgi:hypothetical protein
MLLQLGNFVHLVGFFKSHVVLHLVGVSVPNGGSAGRFRIWLPPTFDDGIVKQKERHATDR